MYSNGPTYMRTYHLDTACGRKLLLNMARPEFHRRRLRGGSGSITNATTRVCLNVSPRPVVGTVSTAEILCPSARKRGWGDTIQSVTVLFLVRHERPEEFDEIV